MIRLWENRMRAVGAYSLRSLSWCQLRSSSTSTVNNPVDERLRILFCGSESFSVFSLRAISEYARSRKSNIESIDVVTRKDKLVGRGLRTIKSPAIKTVAKELGLPLHQIDTFTGWSPPTFPALSTGPKSINLIIAVSFGLLVPPRLLRGATYGGLNVHPSLLPRLKGAAPIHWTILRGLKSTGVSLQTLHESKFDEGVVLDQVPADIDNPLTCTFTDLRDQLGPVGAEILVRGLRDKLYVSQVPQSASSASDTASYAPKFSKAQGAINPELHSAVQLDRMRRAFSRLWAYAQDADGKQVRITTDSISLPRVATRGSEREKADRVTGTESEYNPYGIAETGASIPVGVPYGIISKGDQPQHANETPLILKTIEGSVVIPTVIVSGTAPGYAFASAARQKLLDYHSTVSSDDGKAWDIYKFHAPIRGDENGMPAII